MANCTLRKLAEEGLRKTSPKSFGEFIDAPSEETLDDALGVEQTALFVRQRLDEITKKLPTDLQLDAEMLRPSLEDAVNVLLEFNRVYQEKYPGTSYSNYIAEVVSKLSAMQNELRGVMKLIEMFEKEPTLPEEARQVLLTDYPSDDQAK